MSKLSPSHGAKNRRLSPALSKGARKKIERRRKEASIDETRRRQLTAFTGVVSALSGMDLLDQSRVLRMAADFYSIDKDKVAPEF